MSTDHNLHRQTAVAAETCADRLPSEPSGGDVVFGFDGVVDNVRTIERNAGGDGMPQIETLRDFGERVVTSADNNSSLSFEWNQADQRTGGHVAHLSRVYDRLGFEPTMLGMCGDPILDIFRDEFEGCTIHTLGAPGYADAVEFNDGKMILYENGGAAEFDWAELESRVGADTLVDEIDGARLLGIGYWTMIPALADVLDGLREHVVPRLSSPPEHVLLDPADIRGLDRATLTETIAATRRLASAVGSVTVSANRSETSVLASELAGGTGETFTEECRRVFDNLGVDRFVGHSMTQAVVVSDDESSTVAVEPVESPELTTSAGDHFNAGLSLGLVEGLPDDAAVLLGNALAREFVRTGETPMYADVVSAVASYDDQFA
jgi:sugar/nucleoside kinase (ribokinase family)